jgi:TonB family protein
MLASLLAITMLTDAQPGGASARRIVAGGISESDYPAAALAARAQGTTIADVDIDQGGRVTACRIAQSAGHAALDQRTCQLLSDRFRFERAAATSHRQMRIAWQLPAAVAVPFAPAQVIIQTAETSARDFSCRTGVAGRPPAALFASSCPAGSDTRPAPRFPTAQRMEVTTLIADGRSLPAAPRPRGTLLQRYSASFEVAPNGAVTRCTPAGPDEAAAAAAQLRCDGLANGGQPVFEAAPGGAARRGEIVGWTVLQVR